jgi:hypothetical protein
MSRDTEQYTQIDLETVSKLTEQETKETGTAHQVPDTFKQMKIYARRIYEYSRIEADTRDLTEREQDNLEQYKQEIRDLSDNLECVEIIKFRMGANYAPVRLWFNAKDCENNQDCDVSISG